MFKDLVANQAIIISITGLLLSIICPKTKPIRQRIVLYAFNIITIILALTVAIFSQPDIFNSSPAIYQILAVGAIALFTPLYLYNIKIIVLPDSLILSRLLWWALPAAAFFTLSIVWHNMIFDVIFSGSFVLFSTIIIIRTLQELKKTIGVVGPMTKGQVITASIVPLLLILCIVMSPINKTPMFFIADAVSILCSISVCIVTYFNLKKYIDDNLDKSIDKNIIHTNNSPSLNTELGSTDENMCFLAERIVVIVENNKMFLKTDLRVTDIAIKLSTNRTYISQAINQKLGQSFSDFVNNYRIEFAKDLLQNPQNSKFTIEAIAEDSGFSNVTSLNRAFKAKLNTTPHQYRQKFICASEQLQLNNETS